MRGTNQLLALTTQVDEITGEVKPLFSFPVQVCKAMDEDAKEAKIETATPSGAKTDDLERLDPVTGEAFAYSALRHGVHVGDEFHEIPDEAIEEIKAATKVTTMVALGKVDLDAIPRERVTGSYFLQSPAKGGSPKAYRLTYEALRAVPKKGKAPARKAQAIITKRTATTRQKLCALYANEELGCLMLVDLRFGACAREPDAQILAPQQAEVEEKQVDMARKVIGALPDGHDALDIEVDEALPLRAELIAKAAAGQAIEAPAKPVAEVAQADDLTAALEASIG